MENERRNFMRYRMKESVFAAVNYPTTIVVKIKDMSLGGAAFEFITGSSDMAQQIGRYSLDIFMLDSGSDLPNVSFKIFFACRLEPKTAHRFFRPTMCVAEFKDLSQPQTGAV